MRRLSKVHVSGILALSGFALLTFLLWALVLAPRIATAQELKMQTAQVESANFSLVKKHQEILALGDQAPLLAQEAQQLFSRMPQTAQLATVLRQINAAAQRAGISSRNVQVINATIPQSVDLERDARQVGAAAAVDVGVHLATMTVEVTVTGSNAQRLAFLALLQNLDRGLLITGTSAVSDGAKANAGTMTVIGTMFVLESRLPDLVATAQEIIQRARQDASESSLAD
ncbi:MAG: hypothetical protein Q7K25_10135 [Actinomycetota bacterium]|nr:hypothetical protein [Actinomycetota bacterium]